MRVAVLYGNSITVDSKMLTAEEGKAGKELLSELLKTHRQLIEATLSSAHAADEDPSKAVVWIMRLGTRQEVVAFATKDSEDEVFKQAVNLHALCWPYWDTVLMCDFVPEARWSSGIGHSGEAGMYLCVRLPA